MVTVPPVSATERTSVEAAPVPTAVQYARPSWTTTSDCSPGKFTVPVLVVTETGLAALFQVVRHSVVTPGAPLRATVSIQTNVSPPTAKPLTCAWSAGASRRSSVASPPAVSRTTCTVPSGAVATPAEIVPERNTRGLYVPPSASSPRTSTGIGPCHVGTTAANGEAAGLGAGAGSPRVSAHPIAANATASTNSRPIGKRD